MPDLALLADVQRLTRLRHALPVLRHGSLDAPLHLDEHVIVLARRDGVRWALTATNNGASDRTLTLTLPEGFDGGELRDALDGSMVPVAAGRRVEVTVPALFGRILATP